MTKTRHFASWASDTNAWTSDAAGAAQTTTNRTWVGTASAMTGVHSDQRGLRDQVVYVTFCADRDRWGSICPTYESPTNDQGHDPPCV